MKGCEGVDLGRKRLFLLDLDGTVYLEETLLPGAAALLSCVRRGGGTVRYLTNNSSRGVDAGLEKMHRLGVPAEREEFLTAVEATVYYLKKTRSPGDIYYAVGTASFCRQLRGAGFDIRETPDEDVTAVLVGFDTELTYQKVENACRQLARGADFLATNPDWACPTLFGFVPDCGAICEFIARGAGRSPKFIGKPDPTMIRLALEQTGCKPEETLMVGDRLYTDIACGVNAGIDAVFLLSGEGVMADIEKYNVHPSYVFRNIRAFFTELEKGEAV